MRPSPSPAARVGALAALALGLAACSSGNTASTTGGAASSAAGAASSAVGAASSAAAGAAGATSGAPAGGGAKKIALLLPESQTTRYEAFDRPLFEAKVKQLCAECTVVYANANQDASKQQSDAEAALAQGVNVMVLDPVDAEQAASSVTQAKAKGVPVVSYDRLITGAPVDYYISYDNEKVGQLQGQSLVDALKQQGKSGSIVMINGSPTDSNAASFKKGAHSVIDSSGYKVAAEYDTVEWKPANAQNWMEGQISTLGKDGFVGVYAANDGTAGGAIAAMKGGGVSPIPPVTGQDAELTGIQRILAGEQYMTVYKALKPEAEKAAEVAVALANGQKPTGDRMVDNGAGQVPSTLFTPVAVTKANVADTVVKDGFYKTSQICTGRYAQACAAAGLS